MKNFNEYLKENQIEPYGERISKRVSMLDGDGRLMDYNDFAWYILVSEGFRKSVYIKEIKENEIILVRKK